MDNFSHILLTRFNLRSAGKEAQYRASADWLAKRFELFEAYCLPSVVSQMKNNFHWLIYFDVDTPEVFKLKVARYCERYPYITPLWVSSAPLSRIKTDIRRCFKPDTRYLLTTRIDNDDAFSSIYFESLYRVLPKHPTSPAVLNFDNGVILHVDKVYSHVDRSNAFASVYEPITNIQTVWATQHRDLVRLGNIIALKTDGMWLQVVHGANVSNRVRGRRISIEKLAKFDVVFQAKPESKFVILVDNVLIAPVRYLREGLRWIVKLLWGGLIGL